VKRSAALMIRDQEAENGLADLVKDLINNNELQNVMKENIKRLAIPDAADRIAAEAMKLAGTKK
jgi:UDP-N-acetylglucosamine--N-acetylmuramyl-(pentapeptide) pyrophosphoryl-undecaprenol N-acetylglucosamine transferase